MKNYSKIFSVFLLSFFLITTVQESNAQFLKNLANKVAGKDKKSKTKEKEKEVEKVEEVKILNEFHQANEGKIVFFNKGIEYYKISSEKDSDANKITERVIAGDGPFSFRVYLGKPYDNVYKMDIRYTLGGVSLTTSQIREELPAWKRMASMAAYYDKNNYTIGGSLVAGPGQYHNQYTLQEDTYRILLSKVKDQLTTGASLTLKVEILDAVAKTAIVTGEIPLKVTEASKSLSNLNCRCGKSGMKDEKVIKDVKEAFEFQYNDIKKVYKVVLLGRDFTPESDHKGMKANIIFERNDGIFLMYKSYIFYKSDGSGYSNVATIGKNDYYIPVSPTCAAE